MGFWSVFRLDTVSTKPEGCGASSGLLLSALMWVSMPRPTILVIEPHQATRDLWASVLRSLKCRAIAVATVTDAERALEHVVPDLVITELVLGGVNGTELCRSLRGDARTSKVPILMITGCPQDPDRAAAGADVVLGKPLPIRTFAETVRTLISQ